MLSARLIPDEVPGAEVAHRADRLAPEADDEPGGAEYGNEARRHDEADFERPTHDHAAG